MTDEIAKIAVLILTGLMISLFAAINYVLYNKKGKR